MNLGMCTNTGAFLSLNSLIEVVSKKPESTLTRAEHISLAAKALGENPLDALHKAHSAIEQFSKIFVPKLKAAIATAKTSVAMLKMALHRDLSKASRGICSMMCRSKAVRQTSNRARGHKSASKSCAKTGGSDSDGSGEPPSLTFIARSKLLPQLRLPEALPVISSCTSARKLKRLLKSALFQLVPSSASEYQNLAANKTMTDRILRMAEAMQMTGLSRSHIYNLCTAGKYYDPTFPKKIKLSLRAIGFLESEVKAWVLSRKEQTN